MDEGWKEEQCMQQHTHADNISTDKRRRQSTGRCYANLNGTIKQSYIINAIYNFSGPHWNITNTFSSRIFVNYLGQQKCVDSIVSERERERTR